MTRPHVIIIGAGFGGLWAAKALAKASVDVTLIDRNNYHTFLPLLYQVAAAELEPEDIAYPVRTILRGIPNAKFVMAEVKSIDMDARTISIDDHELHYDYLIIAAGSVTNYFGVKGAAECAYPLRVLDDGIELRNHILSCFEQAVYEQNEEIRKRLLTFTIVGGGPTGVEFAGALAELINGPIMLDYPGLNPKEIRVVLLEAQDRLLSGLITCCYDYATQRLRRMGVDVRLQSVVNEVKKDAVVLKDDGELSTATVVWTAGVRGVPEVQSWGLPVAKSGRVAIEPTLQVTGHPEIYVIGDLAFIEEDGNPLPMVAPVAIQQGSFVSKNIKFQLQGKPLQTFKYKDKGTMLTIGRNQAVAQIGGRGITGFPAWVLWLGIHLFNLIGFRNRIFVLINWAWDYFFYERTVRLILR